MTPEETKRYIEHRLHELGCHVSIGKTAHERIFRFTEGREDGTNRLCHKLLSLGALQDNREVNDDVVSMAMTDLAPRDDGGERAAGAQGEAQSDLASIEQLTAVLEARMARGAPDPEVQVSEKPPQNGGRATARKTQRAAVLPKILVIEPAAEVRGGYVRALSKDFTVVEAENGEEAWEALQEQADIELVIAGLKLPKLDGREFIGRIRAVNSPPHLIGIPIIAVAEPEDANAKLRVLMAGANDVVLKNIDAAELRNRVVARHRLARTPSTIPTELKKPPRDVARTAAEPKRPPFARAAAAGASRAAAPRESPIPTLTAERRFPPERPARTPGAFAGTRELWARYLYRISSTTTITLSATVLLALAIVAIVYVGRGTARLESAVVPRASQESTAKAGITPGTPPAAQDPGEDRPAVTPLPPSTKSETAADKEAQSAAKAGPEAPAPKAPVAEPPATANAGKAAAPRPVPPAASVRPTPPPQTANRREDAAATAPPPASAPAPVKINRDELASFLRRFVSIYEAGDLDHFLSLFADSARTNDRIGRRGIRDDYEALFRGTDLRQMRLGEISWEVEGSQAYGWGDFDVVVRRAGEPETHAYTGSLTLVVEKVDGRLRIVRLYHGQRRADSG